MIFKSAKNVKKRIPKHCIRMLDLPGVAESIKKPRSESSPRIHVITYITTHLPTPEGWKAELASQVCFSLDTYTTCDYII